MADIVIAEFMDEQVVREAFAGRDVLYDPRLVDQPAALAAALADARARLVRDRTEVRSLFREKLVDARLHQIN